MNLKALFFAKASYFFYYAALACFLPFLALYFQSLGFTGSQIGLLVSINPLTALFAGPFWNGMADATHRHKAVLLGVMVGCGVSVFLISLTRNFGLLIPLVAAYSFFSSPIIPLFNSSILNLLGDRQEEFGSQRLWASIGWGVAGPIVGWLTGRFGLHLAFYSYLVAITLALLTTLRLPIYSAGSHPDGTYWRRLQTLIANKSWYLFLLVIFLSGIGLSVVDNFLFLYMQEMGASNTLMGLALTAATISEIPVLFFASWMLRRWGTRGLLVISLAAIVFRIFGYTLADAPWQVLLLQFTHGLTYSAMLVAGVTFASQMAPAGLDATAQSVFHTTMTGMGGITGSLAGGMLFERFGGEGLYAISGTVVLLGLVFFLVNRKHFEKAASTEQRTSPMP